MIALKFGGRSASFAGFAMITVGLAGAATGCVKPTISTAELMNKRQPENASREPESNGNTTNSGHTPNTTPSVASNRLEIGTNFWNIAWGGGATDPFVNGYQNVTGSNPWRAEFFHDIEVYSTLRFMDFGQVNRSPEVRWQDRKQKSDPEQRPMAYEWMIDLSNRTQKKMWVCIPHQADDDYVRELARLIKSQLNNQLKVYVEYSNEIWNTMFSQTAYASDQGVAMGFETQNFQAMAYWKVRRSLQIFKIWKEVFGSSLGDRVVRVIASQNGSKTQSDQIYNALRDPRVNPEGETFDALAVAPYFGNRLDGSSPTIWADLKTDMADRLAKTVEHRRIADNMGVKLIGYEGGQHVQENALSLQSDSRMYDLYLEYFTELHNLMNGVFCHYVHTGTWDNTNAWGAKKNIGDPTSKTTTPKMQAIIDYLE